MRSCLTQSIFLHHPVRAIPRIPWPGEAPEAPEHFRRRYLGLAEDFAGPVVGLPTTTVVLQARLGAATVVFFVSRQTQTAHTEAGDNVAWRNTST
jgi:hypothetical protein